MIITTQDYIHVILLVFIYGTVALLLIGFSAFVVNRFWVDPKVENCITAEQDNHQEVA